MIFILDNELGKKLFEKYGPDNTDPWPEDPQVDSLFHFLRAYFTTSWFAVSIAYFRRDQIQPDEQHLFISSEKIREFMEEEPIFKSAVTLIMLGGGRGVDERKH